LVGKLLKYRRIREKEVEKEEGLVLELRVMEPTLSQMPSELQNHNERSKSPWHWMIEGVILEGIRNLE
jgi:hypothetical protein